MHFRSTVILTLVLLACLLPSAATAQTPGIDIAEYQPLVGSLPDTTDDIVVGPNGEIILSRVDLQEVGIWNPNGTPTWTSISPQPLLALCMVMGPDGSLYIGDSNTQSIVRYDFGTGLISTVSLGYFIPIDIIFDEAGFMYVADLTSTNFFSGATVLWKLELQNGIESTRTILSNNIPGAADVADGLNGKLYIGALGLTSIYEYDPIAETVVPVADNCFLVSDLLPISPGRLAVATIYNSEVILIDTNTDVVQTIATALGPGVGAEDLALDFNTKSLLVSVKTGEIHRLDIDRLLRQRTPATPGVRVEWRLNAPSKPNWLFSMAISGSASTGILIPGTSRLVALDYDLLFDASFSFPRPSAFVEFDGVLDANGIGDFGMLIPNSPFLSGVSFYAAGVLLETPTSSPEDWINTNGTLIVIE